MSTSRSIRAASSTGTLTDCVPYRPPSHAGFTGAPAAHASYRSADGTGSFLWAALNSAAEREAVVDFLAHEFDAQIAALAAGIGQTRQGT
jgi:hypothetical protein